MMTRYWELIMVDKETCIVWETLSQKNPSQKCDGRVVQVVEGLLSKCEALISIPSADKKKKEKRILIPALLPIAGDLWVNY
jgi:hypothetical protein